MGERTVANELVINVTAQETRIALIENDVLTEFYLERSRDRGIMGNIYKGRVIRVLPGMQAAFVDIGLEKASFLYVTDVKDHYDRFEEMISDNGAEDGDDAQQNILAPPLAAPRESRIEDGPQIQDLLHDGQEISVQVSKEPLGTKGARITSHISLPGRYLVYMPMVDHVGISRRIEDPEERARLKDLVERIKPQGSGFIVRTISEGVGEEKLLPDMEYLVNLWTEICRKRDRTTAPALLHKELDMVLRTVRDVFDHHVDGITVDNHETLEQILQFVQTFNPVLSDRVKLYADPVPIFDRYAIEMEINRALGRKVWLKSGGYIVIDTTEALTAIDVNTGRYVGKRNFEDTILKTNLEAVREIVYQLCLRNIGGIIIIDFIDMEREDNREKIFNTLTEALKSDKARTTILKISELGLVEMTRKRVRENVTHLLCESCPYCDGRGYVKSKLSVCCDIFRDIKREAAGLPKGSQVVVHASPQVADLLFDEEAEGVDEMEERFGIRILVKAVPEFHQEEYELTCE